MPVTMRSEILPAIKRPPITATTVQIVCPKMAPKATPTALSCSMVDIHRVGV